MDSRVAGEDWQVGVAGTQPNRRSSQAKVTSQIMTFEEGASARERNQVERERERESDIANSNSNYFITSSGGSREGARESLGGATRQILNLAADGRAVASSRLTSPTDDEAAELQREQPRRQNNINNNNKTRAAEKTESGTNLLVNCEECSQSGDTKRPNSDKFACEMQQDFSQGLFSKTLFEHCGAQQMSAAAAATAELGHRANLDQDEDEFLQVCGRSARRERVDQAADLHEAHRPARQDGEIQRDQGERVGHSQMKNCHLEAAKLEQQQQRRQDEQFRAAGAEQSGPAPPPSIGLPHLHAGSPKNGAGIGQVVGPLAVSGGAGDRAASGVERATARKQDQQQRRRQSDLEALRDDGPTPTNLLERELMRRDQRDLKLDCLLQNGARDRDWNRDWDRDRDCQRPRRASSAAAAKVTANKRPLRRQSGLEEQMGACCSDLAADCSPLDQMNNKTTTTGAEPELDATGHLSNGLATNQMTKQQPNFAHSQANLNLACSEMAPATPNLSPNSSPNQSSRMTVTVEPALGHEPGLASPSNSSGSGGGSGRIQSGLSSLMSKLHLNQNTENNKEQTSQVPSQLNLHSAGFDPAAPRRRSAYMLPIVLSGKCDRDRMSSSSSSSSSESPSPSANFLSRSPALSLAASAPQSPQSSACTRATSPGFHEQRDHWNNENYYHDTDENDIDLEGDLEDEDCDLSAMLLRSSTPRFSVAGDLSGRARALECGRLRASTSSPCSLAADLTRQQEQQHLHPHLSSQQQFQLRHSGPRSTKQSEVPPRSSASKHKSIALSHGENLVHHLDVTKRIYNYDDDEHEHEEQSNLKCSTSSLKCLSKNLAGGSSNLYLEAPKTNAGCQAPKRHSIMNMLPTSVGSSGHRFAGCRLSLRPKSLFGSSAGASQSSKQVSSSSSGKPHRPSMVSDLRLMSSGLVNSSLAREEADFEQEAGPRCGPKRTRMASSGAILGGTCQQRNSVSSKGGANNSSSMSHFLTAAGAGAAPPSSISYEPLIPETGFKIVVMGTSGSGKTAIIQRFLYDSFTSRHTPTVEDTYFIEFPYRKQMINISISDTSGTYQFPAMRRLAINSGDAFILVYSVDDPNSFKELETLRDTILMEREQAYLDTQQASAAAANHEQINKQQAQTKLVANENSNNNTNNQPDHSLVRQTVQNCKTTPLIEKKPTTANRDYDNDLDQVACNKITSRQNTSNTTSTASNNNNINQTSSASTNRHWSLASLFNHHPGKHHLSPQTNNSQPAKIMSSYSSLGSSLRSSSNHSVQMSGCSSTSSSQSGMTAALSNANSELNCHQLIGQAPSRHVSSSSCSSGAGGSGSRRSSVSAAEAALRTRRTRHPPMVIVANKQDLPEGQHLVSSDEIEALVVIDWNNGFVRASAAYNWNIKRIFRELISQAKQPPTLGDAIVGKRRKSLPPKLPIINNNTHTNK